MKLFILRHGRAEDRAEGTTDFDRRLTPEGIAEMNRVALGLKVLIGEVDAIYSSPLPRALETATIAASALRLTKGPVQVSEKLAAGAFDLGALKDLVRGLRPDSRVMLVGHEPDFSELIRDLTGAVVEMKKAGLALVETSGGLDYSVLKWLLTPRHLTTIQP